MAFTLSASAARTARTALLSVLVFATGAVAARAEHRARLSADLQRHLSGGGPQTIEVIVNGADADRLASKYNLTIKRRLKSGGVLTVNAGQLSALQQDLDVDHLSGNARFHTSSLGSVDPIDQGIGADQVWAGAGALPTLSGRGVTVALIDSGVNFNHKAIRGHVLASVDFTGGDGADKFGHGTHVAAIIEGSIGATADTAMYRGVGYGASLVNLRVLGADGSGQAADVIEAIDWAIDHARGYNIRVINLSLGSEVLQPYKDDPVCAAVERAVRAGILVVAAAGNKGRGAITSPGNSPWALTVGALDTKGTADRGDDELATFSSTGPTRFDLGMKPDIAAPGRRITSAESVGSYLSANFPLQHVAGAGNNSYMYGSGTSMATGFVTGAAALLLQERPGLDPLALRAVLQKTAEFLPAAGLMGAGAGSLNVLAAADYVRTHDLAPTTIAGDAITPGGLFTVSADQLVASQSLGNRFRRMHFRRANRQITWNRDSIIHSQNGESIIWGSSDESIIWGASDESIIWGTSSESIIWGASDESIIWGASGESIIWGASGESIIWGASDESIIWGASSESIIWGASGESIIWGASDESIIWGASDESIIWGASSESIIWGL